MADLPDISGVHHVALTVSDLDASIAWYRDLLGFVERKRLSVGGMEKALLTRVGLMVTLTCHGERAEPGAFSERRCGLDHLSFAVPDRATLQAWVDRLDAAGVTRGQIAAGATGDLVAFRDPDNVALEFYTQQ